jgi:hypothetical protein
MPAMTIFCVLYEDLYGVEEAAALGIIRCAGNFAGRVVIYLSVENMWVQSRLVEGRLVVLAVRGGTAPL